MFRSKLPHMLCAKCGSKVARDAYYCKACGEVVDAVMAPGLKIEDKRFSSRLKYALQRHLIRNLVWGVLLILFAAGFFKFGLNSFHALRDNGSSKIFELNVVHPPDPMTCKGTICHILIDIRNKTGDTQSINAVPYMVTKSGRAYAPGNPAILGNGPSYCEQHLSLTFKPHQVIQYLGLCAEGIPAGTEVDTVELRNSSGELVVSGVFKAISH